MTEVHIVSDNIEGNLVYEKIEEATCQYRYMTVEPSVRCLVNPISVLLLGILG